ncbi:uncharacterized protein LOC123555012 [Mercenaria mercenaria]|uniref:uncharacterized protein LOC123555012 n=1 Tax=Mercenaria mercenaria TaxID=6596 RepID=UPI00234F8153|nr:uncharacterized protein LOC123555012 [Mercenaria mercenaria]
MSVSSSISSVVTVTSGSAAVPLSIVQAQVPVMVVNPMQHKSCAAPVTVTTRCVQACSLSNTTTASIVSTNTNKPENSPVQNITQNGSLVLGNPFPVHSSSKNMISGSFLPNQVFQTNQPPSNVVLASFVQNGVLQGNIFQGSFALQSIGVPGGILQLNPQQFGFQNTPQYSLTTHNPQVPVSTATSSSGNLGSKTPSVSEKSAQKATTSSSSFQVVIEPDSEFNEKVKCAGIDRKVQVDNENIPSTSNASVKSKPSGKSSMESGKQEEITEVEFRPKIEYCYSMKKLSLRQMMELLDNGQNVMLFVKPESKDYYRAKVFCEAVVKHNVTGINTNIKDKFYASLISPYISLEEAMLLKKDIETSQNTVEEDIKTNTTKSSCETEEVGKKMEQLKTPTDQNSETGNEAALSIFKALTSHPDLLRETLRKKIVVNTVHTIMEKKVKAGKADMINKKSFECIKSKTEIGTSDLKQKDLKIASIQSRSRKGTCEAQQKESEAESIRKEHNAEVAEQNEIESEARLLREKNRRNVAGQSENEVELRKEYRKKTVEQSAWDAELIRNINTVQNKNSMQSKDLALKNLVDMALKPTTNEAELIKKAFTLSKVDISGKDISCSSPKDQNKTVTNIGASRSVDEGGDVFEIIDDTVKTNEQTSEIRLPDWFHLSKWRSTTCTKKISGEKSDESLKICYLCGIEFLDASCTWKHILNEHAKISAGTMNPTNLFYFCSHCYNMYSSMEAVREHELLVHLCDFPCYFCGLSSDNRWNMLSHIAGVHSHLYTCAYKCCKCQFLKESEFQKHCSIENHIQTRNIDESRIATFICLFCNIKFCTKLNLISHLSLHIDTPIPNSGESVCSSCRHSFLDAQALFFHRNLDARKPEKLRQLSSSSLNALAEQGILHQEKTEAYKDKKRRTKCFQKDTRFLKVEEYMRTNLNVDSFGYREIEIGSKQYKYPLEELLEYCDFGKNFPKELTTVVMDDLIKLMIEVFPTLQVDKSTLDLQNFLVSLSRSQKFTEILQKYHLKPLPWNGKIQACVKTFIYKIGAGCYMYPDVVPMNTLIVSLQKSLNYLEHRRDSVLNNHNHKRDSVVKKLRAKILRNSKSSNPQSVQNGQRSIRFVTAAVNPVTIRFVPSTINTLPTVNSNVQVDSKTIGGIHAVSSNVQVDSKTIDGIHAVSSNVQVDSKTIDGIHAVSSNVQVDSKTIDGIHAVSSNVQVDSKTIDGIHAVCSNVQADSKTIDSIHAVSSNVQVVPITISNLCTVKPNVKVDSETISNLPTVNPDIQVDTKTLSNVTDQKTVCSLPSVIPGNTNLDSQKDILVKDLNRNNLNQNSDKPSVSLSKTQKFVVSRKLSGNTEENLVNVDMNNGFKEQLTVSDSPRITKKIQKRNASDVVKDFVPAKVVKIARSADSLPTCSRRMPWLNKYVKCSVVKIEKSHKADCLGLELVTAKEQYTSQKLTRTVMKQMCQEESIEIKPVVYDSDKPLFSKKDGKIVKEDESTFCNMNTESPPKRGMRRPNRKSQKDELESIGEEKRDSLPKKRGRPKKNADDTKTYSHSGIAVNDSDTSEEIPPRKRERPRKNIGDSVTDSECSIILDDVDIDEDESDENISELENYLQGKTGKQRKDEKVIRERQSVGDICQKEDSSKSELNKKKICVGEFMMKESTSNKRTLKEDKSDKEIKGSINVNNFTVNIACDYSESKIENITKRKPGRSKKEQQLMERRHKVECRNSQFRNTEHEKNVNPAVIKNIMQELRNRPTYEKIDDKVNVSNSELVERKKLRPKKNCNYYEQDSSNDSSSEVEDSLDPVNSCGFVGLNVTPEPDLINGTNRKDIDLPVESIDNSGEVNNVDCVSTETKRMLSKILFESRSRVKKEKVEKI